MLILWRVIVKEFLQLRRDKKMLPLIFIAPAFQLLALGYAANLDVMHVPLLLVDRDRSAASRSLVDDFIASDYFELVGMEEELDDVEPWFVRGRAQAALVIDRGFGRAEASGQAPRVMLISDGSEAMTAAVSLSYARDILLRRQAAWQREQLARSSRGPAVSGQLELATRIWYNPDLKSRWFYVPAVLAYVLMVVTMVLSSMGVVREKEIGTMEQVI
ncbi:MAG: ABC transporter permease, partial [Acidobacteriota bacterium]